MKNCNSTQILHAWIQQEKSSVSALSLGLSTVCTYSGRSKADLPYALHLYSSSECFNCQSFNVIRHARIYHNAVIVGQILGGSKPALSLKVSQVEL